jgi:serpin B
MCFKLLFTNKDILFLKSLFFKLSDHFKELGATHAFDKAKANFSGITSIPDGLHISKVFHKAVVEINEEGTEAAAATGVMMSNRMMVIQEPHEFNCNRPFLFIIHDNTHNSILFMGKFVKPN